MFNEQKREEEKKRRRGGEKEEKTRKQSGDLELFWPNATERFLPKSRVAAKKWMVSGE